MQTHYEPRYYASSKRVILKLVRNKKLKITDEKMLETVDSPTGKVYIGVNKRPLQKVKKGYGYRGVLLQTDNRVFVQCHVCGLWMRRIAARHLKAHKLTKDRYCEKFGLLKTTALVSDELSLSLQERGRKNIMAYNNLDAVKASKARQEQRKLAAEKVKKNRNRLVFKDEFANRYGLCEKQLGFRLIEYIRKYKSLPSSRNVKGEGNIIRKALARRYGSPNEGFKHYQIPILYRTGTNVELLAPNGKQYFFNYNKADYSPDAVYQWIVEQCPVLAPNAINPFGDN